MLTAFNNKNLFLTLAASAILACTCEQNAFAQKTAKIFVVKSKSIGSYNQACEGFKNETPENWSVSEYDLRGTLANSNEMLDRLDYTKPDLVVAVGAKALAAVTQFQIAQPIVFCAAINITDKDLANKNISGISLNVSPKQQLEALLALNPKIKTVGVLLREGKSDKPLKELMALADKSGITLIPITLNNEKEIPVKLRSAIDRIDALWMLDDAYIHSKESLQFVIGTTIENYMTFMANSEVFVEEGATVALSPSFFSNGQQTAELVKKILEQNLQPRDIPISYHENPELVLNLKIAKKIGLDVPLELINRAKTVYK